MRRALLRQPLRVRARWRCRGGHVQGLLRGTLAPGISRCEFNNDLPPDRRPPSTFSRRWRCRPTGGPAQADPTETRRSDPALELLGAAQPPPRLPRRQIEGSGTRGRCILALQRLGRSGARATGAWRRSGGTCRRPRWHRPWSSHVRGPCDGAHRTPTQRRRARRSAKHTGRESFPAAHARQKDGRRPGIRV